MCFALGNLHSSVKHLLLQCRGTEGQRDFFLCVRECVCARLSMHKLFCRHVETRGVEREQAARVLKKAEEKGLAETGTRGRRRRRRRQEARGWEIYHGRRRVRFGVRWNREEAVGRG